MKPEKDRQDWLRIYKSLTDPEIIAENRRKRMVEIKKEQKRKDVGYD